MVNQYTYNPPFTAKELYDAYVVQGMSQREVGEKFGTTQKVVWHAMHKLSIPTRRAVARNQVAEANNNWRGGKVLQGRNANHGPFNDRGYWYIYNPEHPNATKKGYVAEHIAVATEMVGRALEHGECVHHINLRREDNRPENLIIVDRQSHALLHAQLQAVAAELLECGTMVFNAESGYALV